MYRSSLLLNPKYKAVIEDLGLLSEVTVSPSQAENEVKLWKMGVTDASGKPVCARTLQLTPSTSVEVITALAVSDENDTLCIGCQSGMIYSIQVVFSICLSPQGDLIRSKWVQPSAFEFHFDSAVTTLHFSHSERLSAQSSSSVSSSSSAAAGGSAGGSKRSEPAFLYATSARETGVFSLQPSAKRSHRYTSLDAHGCQPGCACLTDTGELVVGRRDGLFRFKGLDSVGCYAVEGEKQCVASFKDCLLVCSRADDATQRVTIYNPQAHFIEFQGRLER